MQQADSSQDLVPTRFVWPYGGRQVHVCGSFTNWLTPIPMAPDGSGSGQVFAVVCNLPPGYHQYKFIVDGKWQHEEGQAFVTDPLGNTNNWLFVKRPEPQAAATTPTWSAGREAGDSTGMDWSTSDGGGATSGGNSSTPGGASAVPGPVGVVGAVASGPSLLQSRGLSGDADASRARIAEFLQRHTAYELIPESSKVVVLDTTIPVRQAFHALYEQNVHTAPLWDEDGQAFVGMISPGDFIALLCRLQSVAGAPPTLSEMELDSLTIDSWIKETVQEGRGAPPVLISVCPEDSLHAVSHALLRSGSAALPMLSTGTASSDRKGPDVKAPAASQLLHLATMPGVLECLMRHFRGVPNALPLLSQPVGALPIGTWVEGMRKDSAGGTGAEPPRPLVTMTPVTALKTALAMLLQAGVGALPIVDDTGVLLDVYARNDILSLARNNAYSQLPLDSITVSQALRYMKTGATAGYQSPAQGVDNAGAVQRRCFTCTRADSLRTVMETLSLPGVSRLICVEAGSQRIEGIITLSDIATFLFC